MKDRFANLWVAIGELFRARPTAVLGTLAGAAIFIGGLAFVLKGQENNTHRINRVTSAFCDGSAPLTPRVEKNCQRLLTQLLRSPTPEQARRLRQIIKEAP